MEFEERTDIKITNIARKKQIDQTGNLLIEKKFDGTRLCRPWQRRVIRGSLVEQLLQPVNAIVTVCAIYLGRE